MRLTLSRGLPGLILAAALPNGVVAANGSAPTAATPSTSFVAGPNEYGTSVELPEPAPDQSHRKATQSVGWSADEKPQAVEGFEVTAFARDLNHPRWVYVLPDGALLVAESGTSDSANRIIRLVDDDGDGVADSRSVFLEHLNRPFGMALVDGSFYVANVDAVVRFPYEPGQEQITAEGEEILSLPTGGYNHHWTRNIIASPDGTKLYISVGSASNNAEYGMEEEKRRANILQTDLDGSNEIIYASGLRNPVGMDWNPASGKLWAAVNERDKLGDALVPDYITDVEKGGFYGWPYSYFGQHEDPRMQGDKARPELVEKALVPAYATGSHTSSLGLVFYDGESFPQPYQNGAFVTQHGSWNRSELAGYRVIFIPFENGEPQSEAPEAFLTGFIKDREKAEVHGRPVGIALAADGALLVSDDDGGIVWRVQATTDPAAGSASNP